MLDEQFVARCLLDRTRDAVPVLGPEDQHAKNQQVERTAEKVERLSPFGRHPTGVSIDLGKKSTRVFTDSDAERWIQSLKIEQTSQVPKVRAAVQR